MKEDTTKICDKCRRALDKAHSTSGRLQSKKDKDDYFPRAGEQNQLLSVSMSMEIKSESEYQAALKRLDVVFMADKDSPEGKEAAVLVDAIEAYEDIHHPIGPPAVPTMELLSAESAGNNVPLIESIMTRSGYGVKLRFTDGSIGAVNIKDLSSEPVTDVTKVVVVDGQLGIHTLTGWVYEQVCLAECFKLLIPFMANLLIYRVSSSTDLNNKCSFGELNLFLFFFERWQK